MAQRVAGGALRDAGLAHRLLHRALDDGRIEVVTPELSGLAVPVAPGGGEGPLPRPLAVGPAAGETAGPGSTEGSCSSSTQPRPEEELCSLPR